MSAFDQEAIKTLQGAEEELENLGLNDEAGWQGLSQRLSDLARDQLPEGSEAHRLLSVCLQGIDAISGKRVANFLAAVNSISDALTLLLAWGASADADPAALTESIERVGTQIGIGQGTDEASGCKSADRNDGAATLDDAAALLIQMDADSLDEVAEMAALLAAILADNPSEAVAAKLHEAMRLVTPAVERSTGADETTMAAIGAAIEAAIALRDREARQEEIQPPGEPAETGGEGVRDGGADAAVAVEPGPGASPESRSPETAFPDTRDYMPQDADEELIGEFVSEASDLIASAEEALLTLEEDPEDMDSVATVFRAFHTIKGSAAFMDLTLLAEMGHHAETLLSRVRDKEIRYSGGYADLALRSLDTIKELMAGVEGALGGEPLFKPHGYDDLMRVLENPEKAGVSDKDAAIETPRIGDILVAQGKVDRESVEAAAEPRVGDILVAQGQSDREQVESAAQTHAEERIGMAIVKSEAASVCDVGQAIRTQKRMKTGKSAVQASVRVGTERLDRLIDMVGELVIAQSMISQDEVVVNGLNHELVKKVGHTSKIVRELQDMSMSLRMIPLKSTFQKMTRLVRDLSRKIGKTVHLVTEGEDTEIDRNMIDTIKDPLVHMVRNAVDHGIEPPDQRESAGKPREGLVTLAAYHSAGNVVVEIRDDGKGLDRDAILAKAVEKNLVAEGANLSDRDIYNLIFEPGFSTAKAVTDVSGRGVGMDVVRKNIEAIGGQAEIQSESGKGSVFQMRLPLTLAIIDGMVARVGDETYVIPTVSIVTSIKPETQDLSSVLKKGEMLGIQGRLIPLYRMDGLFKINGAQRDTEDSLVVVVENDNQRAGLVIDELIGRQQVVIKSLGETMQDLRGISGGAIMPNGRVGLILDVGGLVRLAHAAAGSN
jgi:two-component system chemotaxis sensor kinase CheA